MTGLPYKKLIDDWRVVIADFRKSNWKPCYQKPGADASETASAHSSRINMSDFHAKTAKKSQRTAKKNLILSILLILSNFHEEEFDRMDRIADQTIAPSLDGLCVYAF